MNMSLPSVEEKFFIEIGTADFDTLEHLAEQGWKGIFVEPVKELFDNLKRYEGCFYENCAVLDKMDTMTIQFYDPNWSEGWVRGVGSLDLDINGFHANPQWEEHVTLREVSVVTLDYLIKKHNVKRIDYLKIDIEGWDYKILDNYSWDIKPKKLLIEHKHWKARGINFRQYINLLRIMGYETSSDTENITAVLNE